MKYLLVLAMLIFLLCIVVGGAAADRLPNQTPENQRISISTVIDVVGMVRDSTSFSWTIGSPGSIPSGILGPGQAVASISYHDSIMTNGGELKLNKNVDFDSSNKPSGGYNLEAEKVMTYNSVEGSHLVGDESYVLSTAGNWTAPDGIRCVFSQGGGGLPAFCNIVSAKSSLINVNSAQVSSRGQIRAVAADSGVPAGLNYRIAVTPDASSGIGYAEGTVKTEFAGSIMEARDWGDSAGSATWNRTAAENSWKDSTMVTGGIKNFQKSLGYLSGFQV